MRAALASVRTALLAPALVLTLSGAASAQYAVEVTADVLNVRTGPMATVLGQVHRGDRFVASASQNGWLRIDYRGRGAWISSAYASRTNDDIMEIDTDVNVRTGPDTSYGRIGVAAVGQRYVRLQSASGWSLIQFDDRAGWVVGWAAKGVSATTTVASTAPSSHGAMSATAEEVEILARIVKGEASQCTFEGKVAVAAVVLNRVRSPRFPSTIRGVAHQPWQFSCYNANVRNRLYWGPVPQSCFDAARAALAGQDPSRGATYYFNPYLVLPSWARTMTRTVRIGVRGAIDTHDFYRP